MWIQACTFTLLCFVASIHCDCESRKIWCRNRYRYCTECTYEFLNNPKNISEDANVILATFHESKIPVLSKDLFESSTRRKVVTLSLTYSKIEEIMQDAFEDFSELRELDLTQNSIRKIEDGTFYSCPYLWIADLTHNNITEFGDKVFNNTYAMYIRLNLSHNHLKTLTVPAMTATLDLSFNFISKIDVNFLKNATFLQKIDFSHNVIDTIDADAFTYLKDLSFLNLSYNHLTTYQSKFNKSSRINNVDLSNNHIETIEVSLQSWTVSYLNLSHNNITKLNTSNIKLVTDTYVYLSHNNIKLVTEDDLSFANKAKLLDLSNNRIAEILAGTFRNQMRLITLDLSNNEIEKLEFGSFYGLYKLEELNLSNNKLTYIYGLGFLNTPAIRELFITNNQLKYINVDDLVSNRFLNIVAFYGNKVVCQDVEKMLEKFKRADVSIPFGPEESYVNGIKCENGTSMWEEPKDLLAEDVEELMRLIGKIQERKKNCNGTFLGVLVGLMSVLIVLFGFEAVQKIYRRRTG